ncbi:unnamed protein product [Bemisia tabaci]|uniref:Lipase domain-containing protein n=2 Tax=Bemisia tabaci TaxID=7038 RepID=A0A9P0AH11_BEMTA|nr:unnamed protein product [Bemisia tabaci]
MKASSSFLNVTFVLTLFIDKLVGAETHLEDRKSLIEENRIAIKHLLHGRSYLNPGGIFDIDPDDVKFSYYNTNSKDSGIVFDKNNFTTALEPHWNRELPVKILTHGWRSSEYSDAVAHIREEYLNTTNLNIVTVDWSRVASNIIYPIAAVQTFQVGVQIGEMIDGMIAKRMMTLDKIHIIGHSLGAHVAGAAGSNCKTGKVYRVTGLDPAMPCFEGIQSATTRLDSTDAEFVDVIHTAAGTAGYYSSIGHADFYPNGGTPPQPGCFDAPLDFQATFACSHFRAHEFYSQSITNQEKFKAYRSESYYAYNRGEYNQSDYTYMGHHTPSSARGVYYLNARM